jgi:3-oxoacyl-[acyl-carrier-protein] synthase III
MPTHTTTLDAIAAFTPERSVAVEDLAGSLGLSRPQTKLFRRIHGLDRLHEDPDLPLLDLLRAPAEMLLKSTPDRDRIRYVILAHTIQYLTPSHIEPAQLLRDWLGLTAAEAFAVTQQNCASGLAAIDIAGELLRATGDRSSKALVITGEKPFSPLSRLITNTSIFGEASAACLVGIDGTGSRVRSYVVKTAGRFADVFRPHREALAEFNATYAANVIETIDQAVAQAGLTLADITMIVPHNVNQSSWRPIITKLGLAKQQVFLDNVARYGHCYCSDPFLNLVSLRDGDRLVAGGFYLFVAVGLGATYAAMIIEMASQP